MYRSKHPAEVSWYQSEPALSLALIASAIRRVNPVGPPRVIDVGGGASLLSSRLCRAGMDTAVLDVSEAALSHARSAMGDDASRVRWLAGDVRLPISGLEAGWAHVWHDRALFHFMTQPEDQERYAGVLERTLAPGGIAIIASFALDGPERCSGLPVQRHDAGSIAGSLGRAGLRWETLESHREEHVTPWGSVQRFVYAIMKRQASIGARP